MFKECLEARKEIILQEVFLDVFMLFNHEDCVLNLIFLKKYIHQQSVVFSVVEFAVENIE
jgi:hypothetical protein